MVAVRNLGYLGTPIPYQYTAEALGTPPNESYGHKMRRLRLELAMTQAEVAAMVGCTDQSISNWERGKFQGNTAAAAELPRRVISLLSQRLRRRVSSATDNGRMVSNNQPANGTGGVPAQPAQLRPRRKAQR